MSALGTFQKLFDLIGGVRAKRNSVTGEVTIPSAPVVMQATARRYSENYFRNRMFRGQYGKKVASWTSALQNSAGTAARITGDLPPYPDNATNVLQLTQNATVSFGQQNPIDGSTQYMPTATSAFGFWVKNSATRSLAFELRMFNTAANRSIVAYCMAEPTSEWQFMTVGAKQIRLQSWVFGTDTINYVRFTQTDTGTESGAWQAGESLKFGNVYVDVLSRPRFLICFDDAVKSMTNPSTSAIVSGSAYVSSTLTNVLTTNAAHGLAIGMPIKFVDAAPTSLALNTVYYVKTVPLATTFTLATDQFTLATTATTTGFAGTANWVYAGSQARTNQQVVEQYGFKGSMFVIGAAIGTTGIYGSPATNYLTAAEIQQMQADGWSIGSHSQTHPFNAENAGLRLLGPYGYFLSNTVDNLPAAYVAAWSLGATNRRRVTAGTQASPSVFTTENPHKIGINQPIVFTDVAPTGCTLGVTYYLATAPTSSTFTLATDQGSLAAPVNNTTGAWSGTSNYRYPGSANDDTAIYADVLAGINALTAIGITTGAKYFALPQGGADQYVRSACIRAGVEWVRGISGSAPASNTIGVGLPTGNVLYGVADPSGGWLTQPDAIQTDGASTFTQIKTYVDDCITHGACGSNYHHGWGITTHGNLDQLCAYLRVKADAGQIDVLTLDDLQAGWKF